MSGSDVVGLTLHLDISGFLGLFEDCTLQSLA